MDDRDPNHRTPPEVVERVLAMLRTPEAKTVSFRTDLDQDIRVLRSADPDGTMSVAVTTKLGNRRSERCTLEKAEGHLRSGFWFAQVDGVLHDGGFFEDRARADSDMYRDVGNFMDQMKYQNLFEAMLRAAGREEEADALEKARIEDIDVGAIKAFIAEAVSMAAPGFAQGFVRHREPAEEPGAPRM